MSQPPALTATLLAQGSSATQPLVLAAGDGLSPPPAMPAAGDLIVVLTGSSVSGNTATGVTGPEGTAYTAGPAPATTSHGVRLFAGIAARAHTTADSYTVAFPGGASSRLAMILRCPGAISATPAPGAAAAGFASTATPAIGPITPPAAPALVAGGFQQGTGAGGAATGSPSLPGVAGLNMPGANPWMTLMWEVTADLTPRAISGTAPAAAAGGAAIAAWALAAPLAGTLKLYDGQVWQPIATVPPAQSPP